MLEALNRSQQNQRSAIFAPFSTAMLRPLFLWNHVSRTSLPTLNLTPARDSLMNLLLPKCRVLTGYWMSGGESHLPSKGRTLILLSPEEGDPHEWIDWPRNYFILTGRERLLGLHPFCYSLKDRPLLNNPNHTSRFIKFQTQPPPVSYCLT